MGEREALLFFCDKMVVVVVPICKKGKIEFSAKSVSSEFSEFSANFSEFNSEKFTVSSSWREAISARETKFGELAGDFLENPEDAALG